MRCPRHRNKAFRGGLDQQKPLPGRLHFVPPAINRFHVRENIHAGRQLMFHQMPPKLARFLFGACSSKDDSFVSHIESCVENHVSAAEPSNRFLQERVALRGCDEVQTCRPK